MTTMEFTTNRGEPDKDAMYAAGLAGGRKFLTSWDWDKWKSGDYTMKP